MKNIKELQLWEIETVGLSKGRRFLFYPGISKCGEIEDGVFFRLCKKNESGGFIVSFKELEKVYNKCKKVRRRKVS